MESLATRQGEIAAGAKMRMEPLLSEDIAPFLEGARDEGWISQRRELEYLLGTFPEGCLVWREEGRPVGFVTAARHGKSGWIGNLLVAASHRGRGIGSYLFEAATETLTGRGVDTIWLTASPAGSPLYQRRGFKVRDRVRRWVRPGGPGGPLTPEGKPEPRWIAMDRLGWGDDRERLLDFAGSGGGALGEKDGFLIQQPLEGGARQIGPCAALTPRVAGDLLARAVEGPGRVVLDAPAGNVAGSELLPGLGFEVRGETELMYAGLTPAYRPEYIYALASLGSIG